MSQFDPQAVVKRGPFAQWAFVDVTFTAANTDEGVSHPFPKVNPEGIRWIPVATEGDAYIYRAAQGTRPSFDPALLWLRASAPCSARLLLFVEQ